MTTNETLERDFPELAYLPVVNWEAIDADDERVLPEYWNEAHANRLRSEKRRLLCQVLAALVFCVTLFAAGFYCGLTRTEDGIESESFSTDGLVGLRFGHRSYVFAPNVARAIGEDLIESVDELEGGVN